MDPVLPGLSWHPLLAALHAIRASFHRFVGDQDAVELLRVSRTTALTLLPGFTFQQRVFWGLDQEQMFCMKALYEKYDMRVTRMCLSGAIRSLSIEEGASGSPFPSSLTSLILGPAAVVEKDLPSSLFADATNGVDAINCLWSRGRGERTQDEYEQLLMEKESRPVTRLHQSIGPFNCPLAPGLLPHGLRRLQFAFFFDWPLLPGSIPSTVEILQFERFNQKLLVEGETVLPSSLIHLVMPYFNLPLLPGSLPPSFQRLRMDRWCKPLHVGVLPGSLKALQVRLIQPLLPGMLPLGLTHLALSGFTPQIIENALPSTMISLDMGVASHHPLLSGKQRRDCNTSFKTATNFLTATTAF